MSLVYFQPDIEFTEKVEQSFKMLEAIYDAVDKLEKTWCYYDNASSLTAPKTGEYDYHYVFTFSHQFFFFDVFADLNKNIMYFRDRLNFLYYDEEKLTASGTFDISTEEFMKNMKKFMVHNKLKHGLEKRLGDLNISMLVDAIETHIELELPISYVDDDEELQEILDFLQQGKDKHKFEIFNELFKVLIEKKYHYEIIDGDFVDLQIYYEDKLMAWQFNHQNRRLNLMLVTIEKINYK